MHNVPRSPRGGTLPVVLQSKIGVTTTKYLYSADTRPLAQNATAWEYLLPDTLGSVRQIANSSGYINLTKDYEPYGSVLNSSGGRSSIYGFTGEQTDSQTGLLFLRARYMQPTWGVFLTEDKVSGIASLPLSMHLYLYAWANPVNRIDPGGLQQPPPKCDFGDICSGGPTEPYVLSIPPVIRINPNPPIQPKLNPIGIDFPLMCVRQPLPGEDWGALLIYQIPSLWYQRTEYVVIKIGGELGAASGAIEYRHVVLNPLAGPGTYSEFDELGSAGVGANLPKVGGIDVGAEVSHDGREFNLSPSMDVKLAGGEVNLQPNQAMAGYVNPVTGTGMRGGFQWEYARQVWALTTKYSVDSSGGTSRFGEKYIDPNAELRSEHYEPPHGNMSGFDYLWLVLHANDIPTEEHK